MDLIEKFKFQVDLEIRTKCRILIGDSKKDVPLGFNKVYKVKGSLTNDVYTSRNIGFLEFIC